MQPNDTHEARRVADAIAADQAGDAATLVRDLAVELERRRQKERLAKAVAWVERTGWRLERDHRLDVLTDWPELTIAERQTLATLADELADARRREP